MTQRVVTLAPGGPALAEGLGFGAKSVVVNNYTSSYLRLPDVGVDLPPWVYGAVAQLEPPTAKARAILIPTVPAVAGPPVPVTQATLTWTDLALPADPGHLLAQSSYQLQEVIAEIITTGNAQPTQRTVGVPPGTQAIGYVVSFGSSFHNPGTVSITGVQSGRTWLINTQISGAPLDFQVAPLAALDTSVVCTVTDQGQPCKVDFIAYLGQPVTFVLPSFDQGAIPIPVTFAATGGPVSSPAPWQAAGKSPASINVTLAAGANQVIVPAVAGQTVYLLGLAYAYDAAVVNAFLALQDTAGVNYHIEAVATTAPHAIPLGGAPLPAGLGVRIANIGAAGPFSARGSLVYSQF